RLLQHPCGEALWTQLLQLVLRSGRRVRQVHVRRFGRDQSCGTRAPLDLAIAVDDDVADERQQAARTVAFAWEAEQLRRFVDEARRVLGCRESRVHDDLIEEAQVRRQA